MTPTQASEERSSAQLCPYLYAWDAFLPDSTHGSEQDREKATFQDSQQDFVGDNVLQIQEAVLSGSAFSFKKGFKKLDPLIPLLFRASRAHWITDFQEMREVSQLAIQITHPKRGDTLNSSHTFLRAELQFLADSLLAESPDAEPPAPFSAPLPLQSQQALLTLMPSLWACLLWSAGRLAQGHYPQAIDCLTGFQPCLKHAPAAYRLRHSIILGICFQASGKFENAKQELQTQQEVLKRFPSSALDFAILRRRLSFALESEDVRAAIRLAREMDMKAKQAPSDYLSMLYFQEKIKLKITLGESAAMGQIQETQENLIKHSDIPQNIVTPLEERCEVALAEQRPRDALKIVAEQAWLGREKGMVNGQLISGMILFQCQAHLGQVQAARTTLNELRYLCQTYRFGRDAIRASMLEVLWHFRRDQPSLSAPLLLSVESRVQKLGLRVHQWAISLLRFVMDPKRVQLQRAFPSGQQSLVEFRASVSLLLKWAGLVRWSKADPLTFLRTLLQNSSTRSFSSHGFVSLGVWMLVSFPDEDTLLFECASFAEGSDLDKLLRSLLTASGPLDVKRLHEEAFPRSPYSEHRHRPRILAGLQKTRAHLRKCFAEFSDTILVNSNNFGLDLQSGFQLSPAHVKWNFEPNVLAHESASSERRSSAPSGNSAAARNNAPVQPTTIRAMEERILLWLKTHGPSSGSRIAEGMGFARKSLHFYLKNLVAQNRIKLTGLGRNARYFLEG